MIAKKKPTGIKKGRWKYIPVPVLLFTFFLVIGVNVVLSQEAFKMDENMFQKFRLAKRMFEKGQECFLKEKYEKAEEAFLDCLNNFPRYSQAYYYLSQIYYKKGEFDKALGHINTAKENYKFMADLLVASQQKYVDELRTTKQDLQNKLLRMTDKFEIEKVKAEIGRINTLLTEPLPLIAEMSADYYYIAGNIFMKLKKYNDAHDQYMEAIHVNPGHGNALNNLANLYFMIKKYQQALDYLNQAQTSGVKINQEFKKALLKALGK